MSPLVRRATLRHVPLIERRKRQQPLLPDRVVGVVMLVLLGFLAGWQIADMTRSIGL